MLQLVRLLTLVLGLSTQAFASADVPSLKGLDDDDIMRQTAQIFPYYVRKITEDKWEELGEDFPSNMDIIMGVLDRSTEPKSRSSKEHNEFRTFESHIAIMIYVMQEKAKQLQQDDAFQSKLANVLMTSPDAPDYVRNLPLTLSALAHQFSPPEHPRKKER